MLQCQCYNVSGCIGKYQGVSGRIGEYQGVSGCIGEYQGVSGCIGGSPKIFHSVSHIALGVSLN